LKGNEKGRKIYEKQLHMNWNDFTMAQKSELMGIYIKNGVTALDQMRSHFNSFATGGPKDPLKKKEPTPFEKALYNSVNPTEDYPGLVGAVADYVYAKQKAKKGEEDILEYKIGNTLEALRKTYSTGKPVGLFEMSWNSRQLLDNGTINDQQISPLNVLHNYNIRYDEPTNRMYYSDKYDFNQYENFVPGDPFRFRGYVDLHKKATGGNLTTPVTPMVIQPSVISEYLPSMRDLFIQSDLGKKVEERRAKLQEEKEKYRRLKDNTKKELFDNYNKIKNKEDEETVRKTYKELDKLKTADKDTIKKTQKLLLDVGYYDGIIEQHINNLSQASPEVVKGIQKKLVNENYYKSGSIKEIDGIVGDRTKEAYSNYLRKHVVDGFVGPETASAYMQARTQNITSKTAKKEPVAESKRCAKYVSDYCDFMDINTKQSGIYGDAWTMFGNIEKAGGDVYYNIYGDDKLKNVKSPSELKKMTQKEITANPIDYSQLKPNDIVGIYIPSSSSMDDAIATGTTKNTHVGVVDHIEDGVPIIRHNIMGNVRMERADKLTGSLYGKPIITVAATPKAKIEDSKFESLDWKNNKKSNIVYNYANPEKVSSTRKEKVNEYMNGLESSKENIGDLFPNVDVDTIQKMAVGILKKEGNFMESTEGLKNEIGNKARQELQGERATIRGTGLKFTSFNKYEASLLGIKDRDDLANSLTKQARGVMYILSKNMDYFNRYKETYPELEMTDDDVINLTLLSYNQGMHNLYQITPTKLEALRNTAFNQDYMYEVPFGETARGQVIRKMTPELFENLESRYEAQAREDKDLAKPYVTVVREAMKNINDITT
jgi:peptidoglycan hydrolase-like protein with peptidoglycan-binding domain